jgi:iron complex outermembrane receptor protein
MSCPGITNGTEIRSNIYHPVDVPKQYINSPKVLRISESELSGVALTDTLSMLDDRFQLTLGVRRQDIESQLQRSGFGQFEIQRAPTRLWSV